MRARADGKGLAYQDLVGALHDFEEGRWKRATLCDTSLADDPTVSKLTMIAWD